jgi:DNA polymerase-3 subunit delta'
MMTFWQSKPFQQLWQTRKEGRLPHALLFVGPKGTNKAALADEFSRAMLCEQVSQDGQSCHECHTCRLLIGRAHPNVLWVEPEKAGAAIKIDQVRAVNDFVSQTAMQGEYKIVILHPADEMNVSAANALLKTLEEPSSGSLLILISDQQGHLPATVLSRCQRVVFPRPDQDKVLEWMSVQPSRQSLFQTLLSLAEGKGNPLQSAADLQEHDPIILLDFLLSWVVDLLRLQLNSDSGAVVNKDYAIELMSLRQTTQIENNVNLMDYIQNLRSQLFSGINFNKQMMLEAIFMQWMERA